MQAMSMTSPGTGERASTRDATCLTCAACSTFGMTIACRCWLGRMALRSASSSRDPTPLIRTARSARGGSDGSASDETTMPRATVLLARGTPSSKSKTIVSDVSVLALDSLRSSLPGTVVMLSVQSRIRRTPSTCTIEKGASHPRGHCAFEEEQHRTLSRFSFCFFLKEKWVFYSVFYSAEFFYAAEEAEEERSERRPLLMFCSCCSLSQLGLLIDLAWSSSCDVPNQDARLITCFCVLSCFEHVLEKKIFFIYFKRRGSPLACTLTAICPSSLLPRPCQSLPSHEGLAGISCLWPHQGKSRAGTGRSAWQSSI